MTASFASKDRVCLVDVAVAALAIASVAGGLNI
jgi:hypothetical protein